ncbi:MAG: Rab family GTPase, partial [Candidatus Jordarchaeaceae archaeon]
MAKSKKIMKTVVIGDSVTGKTCLTERYANGALPKEYFPTLGSNLGFKDLNIKGKKAKLIIWDLGGSPHFKDVRRSFYRDAVGVVYVFDVTRRETFEHLDEWRREVAEACGDVPGVIVGNKVDLSPREVRRSEG